MTACAKQCSERQTSAASKSGDGDVQHLKEQKRSPGSCCTYLLRKWLEVPVPGQNSLGVDAVDDGLQGESFGGSNLKHLFRSICCYSQPFLLMSSLAAVSKVWTTVLIYLSAW